MTTFGGVETESSYKAGLAFKAETAASVAQQALDWKVDVRIDPRADGAVVNVTVRDGRRPAGAASRHRRQSCASGGPAPRHRPGRDRIVGGAFRATAPPALGRRTLTIELARAGERMFRSVNRIVVP